MQRISTSSALANAFGTGKNGFQDGNPGAALPATFFNAAWCNAVQEELAEAIEGMGVTLNPAVNNQLLGILQGMATTGNVSLALTNAAAALTAANNAMTAAETAQAAANAANDSSRILPITASVASNALACTLNPTTLDFRSSTLGSGAVSTESILSALSLVVPSGATLGCLSSSATYTTDKLVLVALYNGGAPVLGIINIAGGNNLDETTLLSSTAISSGAMSNNVCYSSASISNSPFRVVGFLTLPAQTTAGTWASAPSTIQGAGGQALASLQGFGNGQTEQAFAVGSARLAGVTYYNTTAKPIQFQVSGTSTGAGSYNLQPIINGVAMPYSSPYANAPGYVTKESGVVRPGCSYSVSAGAVNLTMWVELR